MSERAPRPDWWPDIDPYYAPIIIIAAFGLGCLFGTVMGLMGAHDAVQAVKDQYVNYMPPLPYGYNFSLNLSAGGNESPAPSLPLEDCRDVQGAVCPR